MSVPDSIHKWDILDNIDRTTCIAVFDLSTAIVNKGTYYCKSKCRKFDFSTIIEKSNSKKSLDVVYCLTINELDT
jgi:hypothetical protein